MKKRVYGRKFSRDRGARAALFRSLVVSLIRSGQIKTTLPRAKAVKPLVEHLVTLAKKGDLNSTKRIMGELAQDKVAVKKLAEEVTSRFKDLNSGFTRTVRIGKRVGDNTTVVKLMWSKERVENEKPATTDGTDSKRITRKSAKSNEKSV